MSSEKSQFGGIPNSAHNAVIVSPSSRRAITMEEGRRFAKTERRLSTIFDSPRKFFLFHYFPRLNELAVVGSGGAVWAATATIVGTGICDGSQRRS